MGSWAEGLLLESSISPWGNLGSHCIYVINVLIHIAALAQLCQMQIYNCSPAPPKVKWGYTGFTAMSVRPSVRPSVDKVSGKFWKFLAQFIPYLAFTLIMSLLTPIYFHVPSLTFGPLVAIYLAENGVSVTVWGESLDP